MLARVALTTANRPELLPDETLLFVQSNVGLYEGKNKLPNQQNGFAYLTTHRACYVDNAQPRKYSTAVELKDVDRVEPYAGFLKSSPKITLHLKANVTGPGGGGSPPSGSGVGNGASVASGTASPALLPTTVTWICPICSFSNPLPSNHVPGISASPPCLTCGIKPSDAVLSAALAAPPPPPPDSACPRCTFHNHPSLSSCEICGASLVSVSDLLSSSSIPSNLPADTTNPSSQQQPTEQIIKFSFRGGGHGSFLTHLRSALIQRKWLLSSAPPIPRPDLATSAIVRKSTPSAGIAGLESTISARRNRAIQIGSGAFEDLNSLMTHAKDLISLAETFQARFSNANNSSSSSPATAAITQQLNLLSKDQLSTGDEAGWIDDLSRQVADFLLSGGLLKRSGGIMTLVDVFATLNRARAGIDLVSPTDLAKAVARWKALQLPIRSHTMKSGLVVVREAGKSQEKMALELKAWIEGLEAEMELMKDAVDGEKVVFEGVTVADAAQRWGWSLGVAAEELEECERRGWICRDVGVEGVRFWGNRFLGWSIGGGDAGNKGTKGMEDLMRGLGGLVV